MKRIILVILSLILVTGALCSCDRVEEPDAQTIVADLVNRAYVLNVIYYGEGLKATDEQYQGNYYYVAEGEPLRNATDLKAETKAVFSESMANELIDIYLDGASSYGVALGARYLTGLTGFLTVDVTYKPAVKNIYKYDTTQIKIEKIKRNEIIATIPAIIPEQDATAPFEIEVIVIYDKDIGEWRLDSPTY